MVIHLNGLPKSITLSYEIKKDKIIYKPVAGLTIKNAINEGIEIAKIEKKRLKKK